jgi:hypothetical protein
MSRFARKPVESSRAFGAVAESQRPFELANEKHYSVGELAALGPE